MKKLTLFLFGSFLFSALLNAQPYVTKHTANATIDPLWLDYSSSWATPVELVKYTNNDFSIVHYNEAASGNIVIARSFGQSNPLFALHPMINVPTGSNYLVVSRNNSTVPGQIVLTHVNFALNSVIFSTQFSTTQTVPGQTVTGLTPVDAVYDGSQYVFLLMSGTGSNPSGRKMFLVAKIDLTNPVTPIGPGQIQSWGPLVSGVAIPLHFYPNDIEYVDNTTMLVTGTCVDVNTGAVQFFVYRIYATLGTYLPYFITQSNATYVPQRLFVKSDGANAYFIGENKLTSGAYGPTLFSSYVIAPPAFGANNYTFYYDVVDWTNMTSSYYNNNEIVVGGKLSGTPNRSANLLFNTTTGALADLEYYTMSTNPARSIISPASGRVFSSVKLSTTEWDVFRTGVSNLSTPCKSANMTASQPTGTINMVHNNITGHAFSPSFSGYALVPVSPVYTWVNHCGTPGPEEGRAADFNVPTGTFALYPNPSQGSFSMVVYSEQEGARKLELYDLSGRQVYAHTITVSPGENTINLAPEGLKPGIYLLRLEGTDKTIKLVIQE